MAKFQVENNIRLVLDGPVAPTDTQIAVQRATAPDREPTAPTGGDKLHLTLVDNFGSPSVTEVVNVTAITDNIDHLLLTVERAQENTTAASFTQGFVFQAATAAVIDSKLDADDAQAHFDRTDNPHSVTKAQVGLSDVDNVSAADLRDRSTHTGTQPLSTISDAGDLAGEDDAPLDGNQYARKNGAWSQVSLFVDGGFANSVYTTSQSINGGTA